jgi:hypothetical protein
VESGGSWVWGECQGAVPQPEVCDDGLDNDCDGAQDNGCPCSTDLRPCGPENVGLCHAGVQRCTDGVWGECSGVRGPEPEECDGLDNDCDRQVDEVCECVGGVVESCGTDEGACRPGTRTCQDGTWSGCVGVVGSTDELCDSKDNDCDGTTNEDFPNLRQPCEAGQGDCRRTGIIRCSADGTAEECNAVPGTSVPEECDGRDNDCDGTADEDFPGVGQPCTVTLNQCSSEGTTVCGGACDAPPIPVAPELCDEQDNDCNGQVDELFTLKGLPCAAGLGECFTQGLYRCTPDASSTFCDATPPQGSAEQCDQRDNDCDGFTDEEWRQDCSSICGPGYQFCIAGAPGPCTARQPTAERCDFLDNDCDTQVDEDYPTLGTTCQAGQGACLSLGYIVCDTATGGTKCNAVAGRAQDEGDSYNYTCEDGIDNDCDGLADWDDDDCTGGCTNFSMRQMVPLQGVAGGLGILLLRRKKPAAGSKKPGGAS